MMNAEDIRRYRERNLYRGLRWDDWVEKNIFKLSDASYDETRKAWFKGYNTGEELDMNRNLAEINGVTVGVWC